MDEVQVTMLTTSRIGLVIPEKLVPSQAGIQCYRQVWISASEGMTHTLPQRLLTVIPAKRSASRNPDRFAGKTNWISASAEIVEE